MHVQYNHFIAFTVNSVATVTATTPSSVMIAMPSTVAHTTDTTTLVSRTQNLYTYTISNTSPSIGTWTTSSVTINAAGDTNNGIATTPVTPCCQVSQTKGSTTNLYKYTISNTSPSIGTWTTSSVTINAAGDTNNGIATTPETSCCQVSQTKGSTTNYQALLVFVPLFVMSLIANVILTLTIILKKKKATEHTLAKKCEMEDNPCYGPIKKTRSSDNNTDLHVYDTVQGGN